MNIPGVDDRPVRVATWGRTDPGLERDENQDAFLILELTESGSGGGFSLDAHGTGPHGFQDREFALGRRGAVFVVADGMGGAAGGATASRMATERIREEMAGSWLRDPDRSPRGFAGHLVHALNEANRALHELASRRPELRGMGTTATAVGVLDGFAYVGQVGDSRAYLVRDGAAHQLSRDQSVVQELLDAGALTEAQAERSHQRNVILQALGTAPDVDVDLTWQELRRGDTLLVCSDGLSGVVGAEELAARTEGAPDPAALCETMVELAHRGGAPDNVTVVVAHFGGPGLDAPSEGDVVGRRPFHLEEE